ncbi:MAG: S41 family peptidase [Cyclobacteriaceae bacterium]
MFSRSIIFIGLFIQILTVNAQQYTDQHVGMIRIAEETLKKQHIEGARLSSEIAERFPSQFISELDPDNSLMRSADVEVITSVIPKAQPYSDQEILKLLETAHSVLKIRLETVRRLITTLPEEDFFQSDSVHLSFGNNNVFSQSDQELSDRWRQTLKYNVLVNVSHTIDNEDAVVIKELLNDRWNREKEIALCRWRLIDNQGSELREFVIEAYLKALAGAYDPHTEYFSMDLLDLFVAALSDETYSTGLLMTAEKGSYLVKEILPFTPAGNRSDEITIGDEIVSITIDGEKLHPACVTPESLDQYFNSILYDSVYLEIKSRKDQQIRSIDLPKTKLGSTDNHIYSYLLKDNDRRIGYIDFPSFYSGMTNGNLSSSKDLAYTLLRMKKDYPEGLILDLRNNGGGSVNEAIELAGFFVNIGPLFYIEDLTDNAQLVSDRKRGRIFTGKTMVLVNEFSASAAELVASAMQKHPDVLIVGSQTYGKSTGQTIEPLALPGEEIPFGGLKITNMKLRGINGESYQGTGVIPDIALPSVYGRAYYSEALFPYSLSVPDKNLTARMPAERSEPISKLLESYHKRLASNDVLRKIAAREQALSDYKDSGIGRTLKYGAFDNEYDSIAETKIVENKVAFEAYPMETEERFALLSEQKKYKLQNDPLLNEAFRIFKDWITLTKQ